MRELDDIGLLREYVDHDSEAAFATLVARHVNKVYSVALRHTCKAHQAEEITQAVFVILAKKARNLSHHVILSGWLYQTARLTAVTLVRSEMRRARREQEAYMQTLSNETESDIWPQIAPLLDTAMAGLNETDRHAVVLRFFDGRSMREVGAALGASEDAARVRVNRAVEKLRRFFSKRGIVLPAAVLTAAISANSVQAAPATLAKAATTIALAKGATASISTITLIKGALKIMAWTNAKTAVAGVVVAGIAAFSVMQHQAQVKLRGQNEALQQQLAELKSENEQLSIKRTQTPRLPAPQIQVKASVEALPPENLPSTNPYARLKDKHPKLTHEQVEAYLKANGRNAANLLGAFRTSGDPALLNEAMQKYPDDPQVAFEAAFGRDLSPEEKRQWLNKFEQSAPDNALANYLSALNYFNSGQTDQAVQELIAASGKRLDDYSASRAQNDVEAFAAAGYSMADAKILGIGELELPQLAQLKQLSLKMVDLANGYRQSGDPASAQTALQMAANIGQGYANSSGGEALISQLVGVAIERIALGAMDPNSPYGNGQTVQDRLNQLDQQKAALHELGQQFTPLQQTMSDQDWINYRDRWMAFGEAAAEQWVVSKYGQQQQQ